jgi:hypothetical protein
MIRTAKADFEQQLRGKKYFSPVPIGQKPPLNYRDAQ